MTLFLTLTLVLSSEMPNWRMWLLWLNNVQHMTIEQATTPRVVKHFRVLDAETGEPVAGARLTLVHNFDWMDDWVMRGTTGTSGVAEFQLAKEYLHLLRGHVTAEGYLFRDSLHFSESREAGIDPLDSDPVNIYIYRGPGAEMGLRVPAGFTGPITYRQGAENYEFQYPPNFPAGQRVWWTDAEAGKTTIVTPPPRIGGSGWNGEPTQVVAIADQPIPMPEPGAHLQGIGAWHIGMTFPNGQYSTQIWHVVIGDRAAAIAEARMLFQLHGNRESGFIYDGWLRIVSPETPTQDERGLGYTVTRLTDRP